MTRGFVSWLVGAILFLFVWWVASAIVGRDIASVVFTAIAVILLARQYRQRPGDGAWHSATLTDFAAMFQRTAADLKTAAEAEARPTT